MSSLQSEFVTSHGQPIKRGLDTIIQMDEISIRSGDITLAFLERNATAFCGVALKSTKGHIELSDKKKVTLLYVWDLPELSGAIQYKVDCPDGILKVWNIYKIDNDRDLTKAEAWTNNSGIIVEVLGVNRRRYRCSDGIGEFEPEFIFEISWSDQFS